MLELFGIDFLFRHDKKSAGISYPGCQRLFTGDFRFRSSRYHWAVIVTRTKSEFFLATSLLVTQPAIKCPSSPYVWETRGKGRTLFFQLSPKKKPPDRRLLVTSAFVRRCIDLRPTTTHPVAREKKPLVPFWYPGKAEVEVTCNFWTSMFLSSDGTDLLFRNASTAWEPIGSLARIKTSSRLRESKLLTNLDGFWKSNKTFSNMAPW